MLEDDERKLNWGWILLEEQPYAGHQLPGYSSSLSQWLAPLGAHYTRNISKTVELGAEQNDGEQLRAGEKHKECGQTFQGARQDCSADFNVAK